MDSGLNLSTNEQSLLDTLATTSKAVRLAGFTGGLADLAAEWARHVDEAELRLFPRLVARGPAADGPVGFCLAEHAALGARLADLEGAPSTPDWLQEAELLIGQLIQHLFLEARLLQPLLDWTGAGVSVERGEHHTQGKGKS